MLDLDRVGFNLQARLGGVLLRSATGLAIVGLARPGADKHTHTHTHSCSRYLHCPRPCTGPQVTQEEGGPSFKVRLPFVK